jgi:hypothetical protein
MPFAERFKVGLERFLHGGGVICRDLRRIGVVRGTRCGQVLFTYINRIYIVVKSCNVATYIGATNFTSVANCFTGQLCMRGCVVI